jgi:hypothetical protein
MTSKQILSLLHVSSGCANCYAVPMAHRITSISMSDLFHIGAKVIVEAGCYPVRYGNKGSDMEEWPSDIRVRQWPKTTCTDRNG